MVDSIETGASTSEVHYERAIGNVKRATKEREEQ